MPTHKNNRIVFDMGKVAYAWFYWRNQHNEVMRLKPRIKSAHCVEITNPNKVATPELQQYPAESYLARARRLGVLDRWIPVVRLRMSAADVLEFTGNKARQIWKTWNEKQFNKKK